MPPRRHQLVPRVGSLWKSRRNARRKRPAERVLRLDRLEQRALLTGVVTIGDSWAHLVAPSLSSKLSVPVYNESFGGGTSGQHLADLGSITSRINAHPDADVVWLSSGGNDILGGGWFLGSGNNANIYNGITSNVTTIVNHILSLRPDIQIVIASYDYPNLWDGSLTGSAGDSTRLLYGLTRGDFGNGTLNQIWNIDQNTGWNQGFRDAEQGKIALAANSRRVHHINFFGLHSSKFGYSGYLGNWPGQGFFPPDQYPNLPVSNAFLADPIHLNTTGYNNLVDRAKEPGIFFDSVFQSASLALSTSTLAFGNVRIGTSQIAGVTASNNGPNFTKVQNLHFSAASGAFGGGGQSFNPLFRDPSLGSDTATANYHFAPTSHGAQTQQVSVTSNSGNGTVQLSGSGVGPVFNSVTSLDFGGVNAGGTANLSLDVINATSDGDLGSLTSMTLISATISGPDADRFTLNGFAPGTIISAGMLEQLAVQFDAHGSLGPKSATLSITTDVGAGFGQQGQSYQIDLSATLLDAAPVAEAGGPYFGFEGSPIELSASGSGLIDSYAWDLDNDGTYETPGQVVDFTPLNDGTFMVGLQVTGPGGTATDTAEVQVDNVAPNADGGGPYVIIEGEDLVLAGSYFDPGSADVVTVAWDVDGDLDFNDGVTGSAATVSWATLVGLGLSDGPNTFTLRMRASDDSGGEDVAVTELMIENAPPTATISGPLEGVPWQPLAFQLSALDPSPGDQTDPLRYDIDWNGDGTIDQSLVGADSVTVEHRFPNIGNYVVRVTATDRDDGTSVETTHIIDIKRTRVAADPDQPGLTSLFWGGTSGMDEVNFSEVAANTVRVQNVRLTTTLPIVNEFYGNITGRVLAFAGSGDDTIDAGGLTSIGARLDGGTGDDTLLGGGGHDELWGDSPGDGGEGQDYIEGAAGNDTVYGDGAEGADDTIYGGDGDDVIYGDGDGAEGHNRIDGGDGNDFIYANAADGGEGNDTLFGGNGHDTLYAGRGNDYAEGGPGDDLLVATGPGQNTLVGGLGEDILAGGDGDDVLVGGDGRDLLVGGPGADMLEGGLGDDLLIAGYLDFDADDDALPALRAEWISAGSYDDRVARLRGTQPGGANGAYLLEKGTTVIEDDAVDVLFGDGDRDWYFYDVELDELLDPQPDEALN